MGDTTGQQSSTDERDLVLIVDDEAPIADALAMIVEDAGYTPLVAHHGQQALELTQGRWPALIITDLMMPRLDGAGLIRALRARAERDGQPMPPIILITAGGVDEAAKVGADVILRKPFDVVTIEGLLARFLGPPTRDSAHPADP